MFKRNVLMLLPYVCSDLAPETRALKDISLVNGRYLLPPPRGKLEGQLKHAGYLKIMVFQCVHHPHMVRHCITSSWFPKIESACQFAHHHNIYSSYPLGFQRRRIDQRRVWLHWAEVCVEAKLLPETQEPLLRPQWCERIVPFGPANSSEQHRI